MSLKAAQFAICDAMPTLPTEPGWHVVSDRSLAREGAAERLPEEHPAVYLWRRVFDIDFDALFAAEKFDAFLRRMMSANYVAGLNLAIKPPSGGTVSVRSDFIQLENLRLGGGDFTAIKADDLSGMLKGSRERQHFAQILEAASGRFGPVLYVGETDTIKGRVSTHIGPNSPFRTRLRELGLELEDTELNYLDMNGRSDSERKIIEFVFTHLFVAPLTFRPG